MSFSAIFFSLLYICNINEKYREKYRENQCIQNWYFVKINKIKTSLARLTNKKKGKTKIVKTREDVMPTLKK